MIMTKILVDISDTEFKMTDCMCTCVCAHTFVGAHTCTYASTIFT